LSAESVEAPSSSRCEFDHFVDRGMNPCSNLGRANFDYGATRWCRLFDEHSQPRALSIALRPSSAAHHADRARASGQESGLERAWLADWKSMRFGRRLWYARRRMRRPIRMRRVRLDPGLPSVPARIPHRAVSANRGFTAASGRSVIDYGCGSGILESRAEARRRPRHRGRPRSPGALPHATMPP